MKLSGFGQNRTKNQLSTSSPASVRNARESSLQVKGARLFNLVPKEIRDLKSSVNVFTESLDEWLGSVPDKPAIQGWNRANFLIYKVPMISSSTL